MNLIEYVKEIEKKYQQGQNIFRRESVGVLLERISQLEQSAQHSARRIDDTCAICCETPEAHHPHDGGHEFKSTNQ